jgi:protease IV
MCKDVQVDQQQTRGWGKGAILLFNASKCAAGFDVKALAARQKRVRLSHFMKSFFASLLGTLTGLVIAVVACVILTGAVLVGVVALNHKTSVVEPGSYLVFDLTVNLVDTPTASEDFNMGALFGSADKAATLQLRTLTRALHHAAQDNQIKGLVLLGSLAPEGYGTGFAALKEARAALLAFKASGKPVQAYLDEAATRDLYLTACADELVLNPYGSVILGGLSAEPMFYAGAMERFGVGVQVTRTGPYKSYAEPFIRKDLSPENREQLQKLLDDLWGDMLADIAQDRKLQITDLQALADAEGILTPAVALKAGLVSRIAYRDEVLADLKKATGRTGVDEAFTQINLVEYAKQLKSDTGDVGSQASEQRIAVVYAEGAIVDGEGGEGEVGGEDFSRELRRLRQDDDVRAIVLRVNSPGGSASASEHIQRELRLAAAVKPVVVSMGSYAASGGYWISAYAKHIFAEPTTITGSIGVVGLHFDIKKLANDLGLTWDGVKTGKHADLFTMTRPKTETELAILQRMVDWIYGEFLNKVAEGRGLARGEVARIAQGRVWSGAEALKLGLVDELGGLDAAIAYAAKLAEVKPAHYVLEEFPSSPTLAEQIAALVEKNAPWAETKGGVVSQVIARMRAQVGAWEQFNDPRGIYARLPIEIGVR